MNHDYEKDFWIALAWTIAFMLFIAAGTYLSRGLPLDW